MNELNGFDSADNLRWRDDDNRRRRPNGSRHRERTVIVGFRGLAILAVGFLKDKARQRTQFNKLPLSVDAKKWAGRQSDAPNQCHERHAQRGLPQHGLQRPFGSPPIHPIKVQEMFEDNNATEWRVLLACGLGVALFGLVNVTPDKL